MRSQLSHLLLALALLGAAGSCSDPAASPAAPMDTAPAQDVREQLLLELVDGTMVPLIEEFDLAAAELEGAAAAWAAAPEDEGRRAAAQEAWSSAMERWQALEMVQLGPAGLSPDMPGGQGLRDEIYSWPLSNACRIDQLLVERATIDADGLAAEPINVRGLDALEYVLHHPEASNACPPNVKINAEGSWEALGEAERRRRMAGWAAASGALVRRHSGALKAAWTGGAAPFAAEVKSAGAGSATFPTRQAALNAITDALFYIEDSTRNMKVGEPAGLLECAAETCPEAVESRYAGRGRENVLANLRAFQRVYLGGPPEAHAVGFDDLLIAVGAEALAADMGRKIEEAIAAVEALPPLPGALESDLAAVRGAYEAIREVTTLFKTQFVTVLDLELPNRAEGDND